MFWHDFTSDSIDRLPKSRTTLHMQRRRAFQCSSLLVLLEILLLVSYYRSIYSLPSLLPTPIKVIGQSALHFILFWIHLDAWQVATAMLQYGKQLPEKAKGLRFCRFKSIATPGCWLKRSRKCHGKPCSYCILLGKVKINQTSMQILWFAHNHGKGFTKSRCGKPCHINDYMYHAKP